VVSSCKLEASGAGTATASRANRPVCGLRQRLVEKEVILGTYMVWLLCGPSGTDSARNVLLVVLTSSKIKLLSSDTVWNSVWDGTKLAGS